MTEHSHQPNASTEPTEAQPGADPSEHKPDDRGQGDRVVVASAETIGIHDTKKDPTAAVEEPAKVMRLGMMIKQLLEEVRSAPLDEAARERMAEVHERSLSELESGLSPELVAELHRITLPFADDGNPPSDAELRIAQAQLVGWLEGLFHGIQTALVAQQMAAQNQLVEMRRALPPGVTMPGQQGVGPQRPGPAEPNHGTGQYL
ncbi:bacterial proteasome activator family protein [Pseudactinotalea suaedae]|uniref:bacterial proteasome activator family protein n=1 Tax=Pseudactinotalea suaedae TaxID=1524924 RepID=UPI0012E29126|nr:bacterial proteasome activator family protein [Pseudactinotalea suaedae]